VTASDSRGREIEERLRSVGGKIDGKWFGRVGSEGAREVLVIVRHGSTLSGQSYFENADGDHVLPQMDSSLEGEIDGANVSFSLTRNNLFGVFRFQGKLDRDTPQLHGDMSGTPVTYRRR
jgi:hypothetical protein